MAENQYKINVSEDSFQSGPPNPANQMRRDNDTVKTQEITLYDIDFAIIYHLSQTLKLRVVENDVSVEVPVIYADGEKWVQFRERGYLRDKAGKIMSPVISIRRSTVDKDDRIPMLDMTNYSPQFRYFPYVQGYERYDRFGDQTMRKPSLETYMMPIHTFVRVSYELIVWTRTMQQLNLLVQQIMASSEHLWGDFLTFRTVVSSASNNITNNSGEDRIVSATLNLTVDGYLMDAFRYQESTVVKNFSIKTVRMLNEKEEFDAYITEPYFPYKPDGIPNDDYLIMQQNMKRNIRNR